MRISVLAMSASVAYAALNDDELIELDEYQMVNRHQAIDYEEPVAEQIVAQNGEYVDSADESEEEAAKYNKKEQEQSKQYAANPTNKARFEYAKDACKSVKPKEKKACFTRNWRLYKPQHSNTVHDFRARAHRKCW